MTPSVSVVVPVRNGERSIDECVRSLLALSWPADRLEVLVVDNGSSDGTADVLQAHADRIVLLHERKRGPGAARNAGLRRARGQIVAFTDADCRVEPDWLTQLVPALDDPQVGIAGGVIRARPQAGAVELFGEAIHDHQKSIELYEPPYAITMSWASPRHVLESVGGFDERFLRCEDVDLSYRIVLAGYRLAFAPGAVVYHRNESSLPGLFREGFAHGFHSVRALKCHRDFVERFGHSRVSRRGFDRIGSRALDWARSRDPRAGCEAVFDSGKQAGKIAGSLRFGHLEL